MGSTDVGPHNQQDMPIEDIAEGGNKAFGCLCPQNGKGGDKILYSNMRATANISPKRLSFMKRMQMCDGMPRI